MLALEAAQEPGQHQRRGRSENDESDHAQGGAERRAASQSDNDQQDERGSHADEVLYHAPAEKQLVRRGVCRAASAAGDVDHHHARRHRYGQPHESRSRRVQSRER